MGILEGSICLILRRRLNELVEPYGPAASKNRCNFRFSLRGLLAVTSLVALTTMCTRTILASQPKVLWIIYLLGPWLLLGTALLPHQIRWQQRVMILVPSVVALIMGALWAGASLDPSVSLDQVLLDSYVCWTPQTVFAAVVITFGILIFDNRTQSENLPPHPNE